MSFETKTEPTHRDADTTIARARERAEMLQGLYIHLVIFLVINGGLLGLNALTRGDEGGWWFQWTLLPWGIGVLVHIVVAIAPVFSSDWVDRRTERIAVKRRR